VLAGGRKLAGVLIELGGEFLGPCHAVIGIGVNLRLPADVVAAIDQPVTDIALDRRRSAVAQPPRRAPARRLIETLDRFAAAWLRGDKRGLRAPTCCAATPCASPPPTERTTALPKASIPEARCACAMATR
jgi:biotin-(acetyl-CoA carboxylase) ligase